MKLFQFVLCFSFLAFAQTTVAQLTSSGTSADIGLSQLRADNPGLTEGVGVRAHLVEAFNPGGTDNYVPDLNNAQLSGNSINVVGFPTTGNVSNAFSGHATDSALHFFGSDGVARDLGTGGLSVESYLVFGQNSANPDSPSSSWLETFVFNGGGDPVLAGFDSSTVSSHSYIFSSDPVNVLEPLTQRLDYIINETDTTTVVGTANSGAIPPGWTPSYNAIAVGISDGTSGSGLTTTYGSGRVAIDVVAPEPNSSTATAVVSGAVAILQDAANGSDASRSEVIRATILAGATKDAGDINGTWSRTTTQPLDSTFGAGELNILNSYNIQQAGEVNGGSVTNPGVLGDLFGWDYEENLETGGERFYEFTVGAGNVLEDLSIALTWNLDVVDTALSPFSFNPNSLSEQLANLSLELFDSSGNLVDASLSQVDNVEHIYIPIGSGLTNGVYQLRVSNSNDLATDFGLAFRGTILNVSAVPEPNSMLVLSALMGMFVSRRRRVG